MLEKKTAAPDFNLEDKNGNSKSLFELKSKYKIIYFYPKDNTPGCTLEALEFNRDLEEFAKLNTEIIGISGGDTKSKTKFCEKNELNLTLLSDPDFETCKAYEAYGEKKFMGRTYNGISRITYVLDKNDLIIKIYPKVKPILHSKEVLDFIKSIN